MADSPQSRFRPRKKDAAALWDYALNALGRRALSTAELRQRMKQKAADPADIEPLIARLGEYGYLDDQRFAETYAAARKDNQLLGRQRVLSDLRGRRVTTQQAEEAVGKAYEGTDEVKLVEEFVARKFRGYNMAEYLADPKHLASAYRKLRYAGFGSSASIRVLRRFSARADEIEEA